LEEETTLEEALFLWDDSAADFAACISAQNIVGKAAARRPALMRRQLSCRYLSRFRVVNALSEWHFPQYFSHKTDLAPVQRIS
jgi:hypothetical protein